MITFKLCKGSTSTESLLEGSADSTVSMLCDSQDLPPCAQADRRAVVDAIWAKLLVGNRVTGRTADAFLIQALGLPPRRWTDRQTDEAIRHLGRMLREGTDHG